MGFDVGNPARGHVPTYENVFLTKRQHFLKTKGNNYDLGIW
jgi:hypothetical protein